VNIDNNIPAKVRTDKKRFRQIMFNLIGNALKFTLKGAITIKLAFFNSILFTEVQDTGIGIKEHDLNLLFKFFGQVAKSKKINRGGMGLGLTISKAILQQLGGEIHVESEYEKGSNFKFKIPVSEFEYSAD
jgi:signal transduction histidine kinase